MAHIIDWTSPCYETPPELKKPSIDWGGTADAIDILSNAVGDALRDLQADWTADRELGFVMVRRAMRHLYSADNEEMY